MANSVHDNCYVTTGINCFAVEDVSLINFQYLCISKTEL